MRTPRRANVLEERLDRMAGARRHGQTGGAAPTLGDMQGLMELPSRLKSARVSSTPTAAQFNALVDDVHAIHRALMVVVNAQRQRHGR